MEKKEINSRGKSLIEGKRSEEKRREEKRREEKGREKGWKVKRRKISDDAMMTSYDKVTNKILQ